MSRHGTVLPYDTVPLTKSRHYPHMAKHDAILWDRFVEQHGAEYQAVGYDVAIGGVMLGDDAGPQEAREGWQRNTALRFDAVLWTTTGATIVEVRPWATVSALGAVVCYTMVAQRERLTALPLMGLIVCEGIQLDVRWCALQLGVEVRQV